MNRQGLVQAKQTSTEAKSAGRILQRKCACGNHTAAGGECEECTLQKGALQRKSSGDHGIGEAPPIVHDVLRSPGQPLDAQTRGFMEPRFGRDFSQVRVHVGARAAESARAVNAHAYTVGNDVVFAGERVDTRAGRQLLAHELTHVVQQSGSLNLASAAGLTIGPSHSAVEREAEEIGAVVGAGGSASTRVATLHGGGLGYSVSRASPDAVGYTMRLGLAARTGLQFSPANVADTRVGPVSVPGGLLGGGASRLNVIVGQNLTPRTLARQLLPLWTTATPFTPPGAAAALPLDIITEDELAQGLLVYNQYYLPVPAMTNWRSGLRVPLPVEIDEATNIATVHPLQIRQLAAGFDVAWAPLLDLRVPATVNPPAATVQADVAAFLGREPTALARGVHLGARALTNTVVELPFIREAFRQLGPASFDVALAFMDNMTNREVSLLASQRDGAAVLAEIEAALARAPAAQSATQQASHDRADLMLAIVFHVVPVAPPGSALTRAEKVITVDTLKLDGSTHNPATDVAMANAILSQCNVRVAHGRDDTATNVQTGGWLKGNTDVRSGNNCNAPSVEERALFRDASATFGFNARFQAFFATSASGISASGYSCNPSAGMAPLFRNKIMVLNSGDTATLAHELGHILIDLGPHTRAGLMSARPRRPAMRRPEVSDPHCTRLYNNA